MKKKYKQIIKKTCIIIAATCIMVSLSACNNTEKQTNTNTQTPPIDQATEKEELLPVTIEYIQGVYKPEKGHEKQFKQIDLNADNTALLHYTTNEETELVQLKEQDGFSFVDKDGTKYDIIMIYNTKSKQGFALYKEGQSNQVLFKQI